MSYITNETPEDWAVEAIKQAEYIEALEEEIVLAKARKAEAIKLALEGGVKSCNGYGLQCRYASGEKFVVDADMLKVAFPDIYTELRVRAMRDLKLKPSSKEVRDELMHLYQGEERGEAVDAALESCGFYVKTETQYILTKGAGE